jgi:hypothetical protein
MSLVGSIIGEKKAVPPSFDTFQLEARQDNVR